MSLYEALKDVEEDIAIKARIDAIDKTLLGVEAAREIHEKAVELNLQIIKNLNAQARHLTAERNEWVKRYIPCQENLQT